MAYIGTSSAALRYAGVDFTEPTLLGIQESVERLAHENDRYRRHHVAATEATEAALCSSRAVEDQLKRLKDATESVMRRRSAIDACLDRFEAIAGDLSNGTNTDRSSVRAAFQAQKEALSVLEAALDHARREKDKIESVLLQNHVRELNGQSTGRSLPDQTKLRTSQINLTAKAAATWLQKTVSKKKEMAHLNQTTAADEASEKSDVTTRHDAASEDTLMLQKQVEDLKLVVENLSRDVVLGQHREQQMMIKVEHLKEELQAQNDKDNVTSRYGIEQSEGASQEYTTEASKNESKANEEVILVPPPPTILSSTTDTKKKSDSGNASQETHTKFSSEVQEHKSSVADYHAMKPKLQSSVDTSSISHSSQEHASISTAFNREEIHTLATGLSVKHATVTGQSDDGSSNAGMAAASRTHVDDFAQRISVVANKSIDSEILGTKHSLDNGEKPPEDHEQKTENNEGESALGRVVEVLFDFTAEAEGELGVVAGEYVTAFENEEDKGSGWCMVSNNDGETGFVPETYLQLD